MARRSTATGASVISTLSTPSVMHVPFLVCTPAGDLVRPATILVNQTALVTPVMTAHLRGPVQLGVAEAVDGSRALRQLSPYLLGEMILLVSMLVPLELGYVEPSYRIDELVRLAARRAAGEALEKASDGLPFTAVVPGYEAPKPSVAAAR
jgi:formaldehyde-activating enzyme involved in methanogenesis